MKKEIQPHQARVVTEFNKLEKKLSDLTKFIHDNPLFKQLQQGEQGLLEIQANHMSAYLETLRVRLQLWGIEPAKVSANELLIAGELSAEAEKQLEARDIGLTAIEAFSKRNEGLLDKACAENSAKRVDGLLEAAGCRTLFPHGVVVGGDGWESQISAQKTCPKEQAIIQAKEIRVKLDSCLQDIKAFYKDCLASPCIDNPHAPGFQFFLDPQEVPANIKLAQRACEDAIMRLGMTLKAIGTPTPYPNSYNPNSTAVEPTADGLKM